MGTYYAVFNVTKREWFTGHKMAQGAKWGESLYGAPAVALFTLLAEPRHGDAWRGRWVGDHVCVRGDFGSTWNEVVEALCGAPPSGGVSDDPLGWTDIGAALHEYFVERCDLPCATPTPGRTFDGEPYCARCEWPLKHHGKLVGVVCRRSS